MLDSISLDQLRIFIASVDEGSFSAAARRLGRAQSVVSEMVAALEGQMGVPLFDRSGRYPKLTAAGTVLLSDARSVVSGVDLMKARAKGMSEGVEPEFSAVIDVFFPIKAMTATAMEFRERFPRTPLRLYVEALGGVFQPILDGRASLGVAGPVPALPAGMTRERLAEVRFAMVAAHDHPLASISGVIPSEALSKHVQLVLTDRSHLSEGQEVGVMSHSTWRLADLFAKQAFIQSGLGWGGMPLHVVKEDIDSGRLVALQIEGIPSDGIMLPMDAVYPASSPPGPAGRWFLERLKMCPGAVAGNTDLAKPSALG